MNAHVDLTAAPRVHVPDQSMPVHDAEALTKGGAQARIVLHGQVYSLRITRAGKLILTK